MFNEKSHFFDVEKAQIEPVLVMVFGLIALSFAPFPFYPPRAPQAGPQKTLQICAFLLQVASLGDLNDVSNILLTTSPCIRPHFGNILTSPTRLGSHFSISDHLFSWNFWNCAPRLHRKHNSEYSHKAFLMKNNTFFMQNAPARFLGAVPGGTRGL